MKAKTFAQVAKHLGHDINELRKGNIQKETVEVQDIEQLKTLLNPHGMDFKHEALKAERGSSTITSKAAEYIFNGRKLTEEDHKSIKNAFPMEVSTSSIQERTLREGEVWNLGASTSPVINNIGTLTMEPGSSIKIANTVLSLTVGTLIRNSEENSDSSAVYDLGIFGVPGKTPGQAEQGESGLNGNKGKNGICSSPGIKGDNGKPGSIGSLGGTGKDGETGGRGLPSLNAHVTITEEIKGSADQFVISTQSGHGGQGGQGGLGGNGGDGGKGGKGATCGCECTDGADGGAGGDGGNGGNGGIGGNAVNGENIYVAVPHGQSDKIIKNSVTAMPGNGGIGGSGGKPGTGGSGGNGGGASGCPIGSRGKGGSNGNPGNPGKNGPKGTETGAPGTIYVTESD